VAGGIPAFKRAMPSAFTDVRLGPLIGRGAYGRVYRGSWNGTTVAVKVIETTEPLDEAGMAPGKSGIFEAVLSTNLSHPNIVHTYQYAFRPVSADEQDDARASNSSSVASRPPNTGNTPATEVWLVSEFCNRGPLLTAIERGAFLTQPSSQYGQPNLISVLQTLQEIAAALQYLHRNDVLHGDLTGGNVLLTASDKDTRSFTAKVVDFGLSRVCSGDYLRTRTLGCAEYMPPELITEGILTKSADVYAFGVITWEIYVGRRAWEGLKPTEVLRRVASNVRLQFPPQTPHRLKVLGERCMEYSPAARPTMDEVLSEVNSILSDTMGILQQFLAASSAASAGRYAGGTSTLPSSASELQPSDPFR
jgi:serine/threonine protein kinase